MKFCRHDRIKISFWLAIVVIVCSFLTQVQSGCQIVKSQDKCLMNQGTSSLIDNSEYIGNAQKNRNHISRNIELYGSINGMLSLELPLIQILCLVIVINIVFIIFYIIQFIHNSDGRKKYLFLPLNQ